MDSVVVFVAVWWIANMVATIASKKALSGIEPDAINSLTSWTPALKDLRWIELTMLQHLMGVLLANTWLLVVRGKSAFPVSSINPKHMLLAVIGNVVGNLATNASFAAVSSSLTQVIKSCEPIFTFVFTLLFYKNSVNLTRHVLFSIIAMVVGTCLFISGEVSYNIWGIGAAVISNIAFPIRNIYLKMLGESWEGPLQKYAAISNFSVLILLPFAMMSMSSLGKLPQVESCTSATFHFIYNAASITVLQAYSPVVHALLNLMKRMFVILANMFVFSTPFTFWTVTGLLVILIGHYIYQGGRIPMKMIKMRQYFSLTILVFGVTSFCWFLGFFQPVALVSHLHMRHAQGTAKHFVTTAWVYERPIPYNIVDNIDAFSRTNPGATVQVFCGSSQCLKAVQDLDNTGVTGKFLVLPEIFKKTSLERWLVRHPIHKILTGVDFEDHVYEAVRLALLWHHGGIHFDPLIKLSEFTAPADQEAWVSIETNLTKTITHGILSVSQFPAHSGFIANLTKAFCRHYTRNITNAKPGSLQKFDFQAVVSDMYSQSCMSGVPNCPTGLANDLERISVVDARRRHFGTLTYARRVSGSETANLGDQIQGFPGIQFLPFVDRFVDRDNFDESRKDNHTRMFLNAWYGYHMMTWPPPPNIEPILLSLHIHRIVKPLFTTQAKYLQARAPIGCRDTSTLEFLRQINVDAFFSGCLTLLIKTPNVQKRHSGEIFLVDVKKDFVALLPSDIQKRAIRITHRGIGHGKSTIKERFKAAYNLIDRYSRAHVVITQRVHCALPCVAMGTPVIFLNSDHMPGGNAARAIVSPRVTGLTPLFHTIDAYNMSEKSIEQWLRDFNWTKPPLNPDVSLRMRLRATDWNVIRQDQVMYDGARKFGLLPLSVPGEDMAAQLVLHLIINSTSNHTSLNWPKWRTIESIFYHYPHARVIIHSDSLQPGQFDVLTEAGYTIEVQTLRTSIDTALFKNKTDVQNLQRYGSGLNKDVFAKLAVLFNWGGVYIDADVILLRKLNNWMTNALVWGSEEQNAFDLSFMKFERGHPFLENALLKSLEWQASPPDEHGSAFRAFLFQTWSDYFKRSVKVLRHKATFKQFNAQNAEECLKSSSEPVFESNMKRVQRGVYFAKVTGLTNLGKLRNGTICKYLFNSFCVLCNNVY
ncbi:uncharacterized protein LOC119741820 [Patiria miniata]|uniref:Sugar phosphate transporter domain-containing protein n=1 Tax=Patiria miniata TaxID=46514 RepID=A0A914BC80_PATMI|nr:uncharacterized protein LOC119741820 [Patiria miniata]XP_038073654.1 uncharacterized protein LOC119741820 [Patiria miniata]